MSIDSTPTPPRRTRAILALAAACFPALAHAATVTWTAGDGIYSDPLNWSTGTPPASTDDAQLAGASSPYTITLDTSPTNNHLLIDPGDLTLNLAGHTYTLAGSPTFITESLWTGRTPGTTNLTLTSSSPGGVLSINGATLGDVAGSISTVTLAGANIKVTATQSFSVGRAANASTFNVLDGATLSGTSANVGGSNGAAVATLSGAGTKWTLSSAFGVSGTAGGTLNVLAGSSVAASAFNLAGTSGAAPAPPSTINVDGPGSSLTANGVIELRSRGGSALNVTNGATASASSLWAGTVVTSFPSPVAVTVDGASASLTLGSALIGDARPATVAVRNGGKLTTSGDVQLARTASAPSSVTVAGSSSFWSTSGTFYVGGSNTAAAGAGTLNIQSGYLYANVLKIWNSPGTSVNLTGGTLSASSVDVSGNNSLFHWTGGTFNPYMAIDLTSPSCPLPPTLALHGTMRLWLSATGSGPLYAGTASPLAIDTGASIDSMAPIYVGHQSGATASATVDGAGTTWYGRVGTNIGYTGTGSVTVTNGASFLGTVVVGSTPFYAPKNGPTGAFTVSGPGSYWNATGSIQSQVGVDAGVGTVNILAGANAILYTLSLGTGPFSPTATNYARGTLNLDGPGSTLTATSDLLVGAAGSGTVNITNGAKLTCNSASMGSAKPSSGTAPTSTIIVDGPGSSLSTNLSMSLSFTGPTSLAIRNGAAVSIGQHLQLASSTSATGAAAVIVQDPTSSLTVNQGIFLGTSSGGRGTFTLADGTVTAASVIVSDVPSTSFNLSGGTLRLTSGISSPNPSRFVWTGGTLSFTNTPPTISPTSAFGNSLKLSPNMTLLTTALPTIASGSSLDIAGGTFLLAYTAATSPAAQFRNLLQSGRVTSTASDLTHTVGYTDINKLLIAKLTLTGDANLDGKISPDDYALLDKGYTTSATTWHLGDFNYDGAVTSGDYLLIDRVFVIQQNGNLSPDAMLLAEREAQFGASYVAELMASVPEPGMSGFALFLSVSYAIVGRRERKTRDSGRV